MDISKTIGKFVDTCLDTLAFAGVGVLAGRAVNWLVANPTVQTYVNKTGKIDIINAGICCAAFLTIDRLSKIVLDFVLGEDRAKQPVFLAGRITGSVIAATVAFNKLAPFAKLSTVDPVLARAAIVTAVFFYNQAFAQLTQFNKHYGNSVQKESTEVSQESQKKESVEMDFA